MIMMVALVAFIFTDGFTLKIMIIMMLIMIEFMNLI